MKILLIISVVLLSFGCQNIEPNSIDSSMSKGIEAYSNEEYEKALDNFEEVMIIDPYNLTAIDYIRKIYKVQSKSKAKRSEQSGRIHKGSKDYPSYFYTDQTPDYLKKP